ncbi:MAG: DNA adenine methylase [Hyphomicrobiaceae bacterium]
MVPLKLQPIPYQGSKRALAPRICKLFPPVIDTLYEPFAGSAAVTLYAAHLNLAKRFVIGEVYPQLAGLWSLMIREPETIASAYRALWLQQFDVGVDHFNMVRETYNRDRSPSALLYLTARCVKNAVRFGRRGDFTQSVDKRRNGVHPDKMETTIRRVSALLKGRTTVFCGDYTECIAPAVSTDLIYMDPPYQGTTYGRDKRYAAQLASSDLLKCLYDLNRRDVPFVLSYDGRTGDKEYGAPLPKSIEATHLYIHAGRSSQATLTGRSAETLESLYISANVARRLPKMPNYASSRSIRPDLFA